MLAGLAILLVLFLLSLSVLLLSIKRKQTATYRMNQAKALSLAEVGVAQALLDLERAADIDDDNDGLLDTDAAETDRDGDGIADGVDTDFDGDGIPDTADTHDGNIGSVLSPVRLGIGSYFVETNTTTPANSSVTYHTITSTATYPSAISAISRVTRRITVQARRIPEAFNRHLIYARSLTVGAGVTATVNGNIYTPEATGRTLAGNYTETDITPQTIVLSSPISDYQTAAGSNTYGNGLTNLTFMGSNLPFANNGIQYFDLGTGTMIIGDSTGTNPTTIYGTLVINGTGVATVTIYGPTTIIPYQMTLSDNRHYTLPAIVSNVPITCDTTNGNITISGLIYLDPSEDDFTVSGAAPNILTINGALVAHDITINRDTTINYNEEIYRFPPPYFTDTAHNQQTVILDRGWEGWQLVQ